MWQAIETYYNGDKFRSRLEARWAVFFDAAGIKRRYETEGYEVNWETYNVDQDQKTQETIRYLPDFYLPEFKVYCEVKPDREHLLKDSKKLSWMIDYGGPMAEGLLILGQIPNVRYGEYPCFVLYSWHKGIVGEAVTITSNGLTKSSFDLLNDNCASSAPDLYYPSNTEWNDLYRIRYDFPTCDKDGNVWSLHKYEIPIHAFNKARQARFEHGETPTI